MLKAEIIGNLGADAQIKTDGGRQYVQFSVADTFKFKRQDGTVVENTNWVSCFMRQADAGVVPYLKKGAKVFVRGNLELRLFSSEKDRCMKAGATINVQTIELVGGVTDEVPRSLATESGQLLDVRKLFWADIRNITPLPSFLFDARGKRYTVDTNGFIVDDVQQEQQQEQKQQQEKPQKQEQPQQEKPQQKEQPEQQQQQALPF